jgi:thiamine monophosphate kinase
MLEDWPNHAIWAHWGRPPLELTMEQQFIDWLAANLPSSPHLQLGMGDDAAVLHWAAGGDMVVTTDAVTEGVDFRIADATP